MRPITYNKVFFLSYEHHLTLLDLLFSVYVFIYFPLFFFLFGDVADYTWFSSYSLHDFYVPALRFYGSLWLVGTLSICENVFKNFSKAQNSLMPDQLKKLRNLIQATQIVTFFLTKRSPTAPFAQTKSSRLFHVSFP